MQDRALLTLAPLLYVAWSDGSLNESEVQRIRQRLSNQGDDVQQVLDEWLNPADPPSPSRLFDDTPPRPSAQGNTVVPAFSRPWLRWPGRTRTVSTRRPRRFFAAPGLRSRFFLYDRNDEHPGCLPNFGQIVQFCARVNRSRFPDNGLSHDLKDHPGRR